MVLFSALTLRCVERPHSVDIVPYLICPASGRNYHERGWQMPVLVKLFRQFYMLVIAVNGITAVFPINCLQLSRVSMQQFVFRNQPISRAAPKPMCVDLPLCACIFFFQFNKYISSNVFVYPRFDDGAKRDKDHGYWQLKEYASIGFTYSF